MNRLKRMQFWGQNKDDDRLVLEILKGKKTATACKADEYHLPDGDFDDGGWETGDIVEIYDLRERLRCKVKITEVYKCKFGNFPDKLWIGENNTSAEEFRNDHRSCWPEYDLTDDFEMMATHFKLIDN
ncbi:MAG: ASCH domain-containing protein [Candidatus Marinimicrobia bacterium]|nr:ASCH domain-containing protein [Candidatus Neomarinimicrobiota bacterium]